MTQYIPKDVLVEEIERRKNQFMSQADDFHSLDMEEKRDHFAILASNMHSILSFLDTLEVKEDNLLTEKKTEKELAEAYIKVFDKKFGNKLPNLKSKQLTEFKNFINTCEQTFCMKYFDYHATQGKLFEKLALLWAVWGKEHLNLEVKEVGLEEEIELEYNPVDGLSFEEFKRIAKHFFELGMRVNNKAQKGEEIMAQFMRLRTKCRCGEIMVNVDEISSCHIEGGFSYTDYILILKNGTRYNLTAESYNKVTNLISE